MSTKHFVNNPTQLVNSALQALVLTNPSIEFDSKSNIIYRSSQQAAHVSIVSGGGSGHEPCFGAFVGEGLLSAAVVGTIFASPSAEQVRKALMSKVERKEGILVIIMNYTGDVLNFGIAVEKARAAGINVKLLVVGDDVGVGRKSSQRVGRRGIAGTVLVHKISGALAARKASLEQIYQAAKLTANNLVSVGASLAHVHIPGQANIDPDSNVALGSEEIELGMGIHNEPGSERIQADLPHLVKNMLSQLLDTDDFDRAFLKINSNEIVLLINNLGGLSVLELGCITFEVVNQLEESYNIKPVRIYAGTYMSSLNNPGFSISLLNVVSLNEGCPSMIELLDDPAEVTGWAAPIKKETWNKMKNQTRVSEESFPSTLEASPSGLLLDPKLTKLKLTAALERLVAAEPELTKYDTLAGDGDCGTGLKRCAQAILKLLSTMTLSGDAILDLSMVTQVVETNLDGTSGALYSIFLNSLICNLREQNSSGEKRMTPKIWASALKQSCTDLGNYTPAKPGDRTLVDALDPFVHTLDETGDLIIASMAARMGARKTKGMKAKLGRTVYIGGNIHESIPDPGAWGLSELFLGLAGVRRCEAV